MTLLALAACSPTPDATSSPSPQGQTTSAPPNAVPAETYDDQQLVDIAKTVVQARSLQGMVMDTRSLRSTSDAYQGPAITSTSMPEACSAFRLPAVAEGDVRQPDKDVGYAQGTVPLDAKQSPLTTIAFVLRSASNDRLAAAGFNGTDDLMTECAEFERAIAVQFAGGAPGGMTTTYAVQLTGTAPVGQKAYATVQKAKGLGTADMGAAGMQVLAGTLAIEMALTLWPVSQESADQAKESMTALARELIDQAVKNPPSSPRPVPAGARSPDDLARLLTGVTGPAGTKLYVSPTEARTITSAQGSSPLPSRTPCSYDDATYFAALAEGATMAKAIASTEDKMIALDVTAISLGSAVQQPFPFDGRATAIKDCTTIQANITGKGALAFAPVRHLEVKFDGESGYAFSYQAAEEPGRWYIRLGARKGTTSVEVSSSAWSSLEEDKVQAAVEAATAVIEQALRQ